MNESLSSQRSRADSMHPHSEHSGEKKLRWSGDDYAWIRPLFCVRVCVCVSPGSPQCTEAVTFSMDSDRASPLYSGMDYPISVSEFGPGAEQRAIESAGGRRAEGGRHLAWVLVWP